ncbi:MAG: BON domain-containing protein [Burkholderiales bacterium]
MKFLAILLCLAAVLLLGGCPAAIIGGGAVAYGTIEDRRTSGTMIDDDSIETRIGRSVRERYGENTHVNVTSFNRSVLLTGEVPEEARRAEIEKLAQGAGNVRNITNELQVGAPSSLGARANDSYITTKVKGRLLDSNKVNPLHVKVVTEAAVVYLMGIVTEQEAADAVDVARNTGGVVKVVRIFDLCKVGDGVCPAK